MQFKKFYSYRVDGDNLQEVVDKIAQKMDEFSFEDDPVGNRAKNSGWVKVNKEYEEMFAKSGDVTYFSLMVATKKVPRDKLNRKLDEKVQELRESSGEEPSKKEIKEIKLALEETLIVDEEPKYKRITASFDTLSGRIDVDSGAKDAEEIVSFMRSTIGGSGIKATPFFSSIQMSTYKHWLLHGGSGPILMGQDHTLKDSDGTTVTYKKVNSSSELMLEHLKSGYEVKKTSLIVDEKFSGTINEKGEISGFKLEDMGVEEIDNELGDMEDGYFDAYLGLMSEIRGKFVNQIYSEAKG